MRNITIGLVGNPNCGKTTFFNLLTGSTARVGNWAGVTVESHEGEFTDGEICTHVVDLPGVYSLSVGLDEQSLDEQVATNYILSKEADVIVNVIDASNLERNLYLTTQLLEMQVPVIIALNMVDVARKKGMNIDLDKLSAQIGAPVIACQGNKGVGVEALKKVIVRDALSLVAPTPIRFDQALEQTLAQFHQTLTDVLASTPSRWLLCRLLEGDSLAWERVPQACKAQVHEIVASVNDALEDDADIILADARYTWIEYVKQTTCQQATVRKSLSERIDSIVLNRWLGIPIFLVVMYSMFFFAINVGGAFQDFFDISSTAIFVHGLTQVLMACHSPTWLTALIANGVGMGINTTVTFIPVIGAMFLFLSMLEDSGYMARAAFVMDRFMRAIGLPGKSFVPMIVGFGCNVPAVMAARTLEDPRDRILTILMAPFMSCGARLAIFAVFTAAFFPVGGQNVVFALYLIGIVAAVVTGLILRRSLLKGGTSPLLLELPTYHLPHFKTVKRQTWFRLKNFLFKAGKLIIPICMLIGALNSITLTGHLVAEPNSQTLLSAIGRGLTPLFTPMGIAHDNWPATVGLITGVLAKEVVVATLNTLYSQVGHLAHVHAASVSVIAELKRALMSIPQNLMALKQALVNPVLASAAPHDVTKGVFGQMYLRFSGGIGAFAYLLFILLYFPCVSTTAAMTRELNRGWAIFSMCWSTGLAYAVAVCFYQLATLNAHPMSSLLWVALMTGALLVSVLTMKWIAREDDGRGEQHAECA